jgi:hypothetical protein
VPDATRLSAAIGSGRHSRFLAKDLGEMTRARIADIHRDGDDRSIGFAQKLASNGHPQPDEIMRGCKSSGALELSAEMRLAHAGSVRITVQIEIACQLLLHQICYVPER